MDISSARTKQELIRRHTPKTKLFKTVSLAFITGAVICGAAEGMRRLFLYLGSSDELSFTLTSLSFILIASLLTAVGVFDRIARHSGAGTLVPITGFSNAITSEAMDSASEGYVLGVGAKIFTVAGPVLLFGIFSGVIYGVIYYAVNYLSGGGV